MAETPQDRIAARDAAQRVLDAAVLAYRADPSPQNREANLAAAGIYMAASQRVIADELIEMQNRPASVRRAPIAETSAILSSAATKWNAIADELERDAERPNPVAGYVTPSEHRNICLRQAALYRQRATDATTSASAAGHEERQRRVRARLDAIWEEEQHRP